MRLEAEKESVCFEGLEKYTQEMEIRDRSPEKGHVGERGR